MPRFLSLQSAVCNKFKQMTHSFHGNERKKESVRVKKLLHNFCWNRTYSNLMSTLWNKKVKITLFHSKRREKKIGVSMRHCNSKNNAVFLPLLRNRNILLFWSSWPKLAVELIYNSIRCQLIHSIVFERRSNTVVHTNQNTKKSH